MRSRNYFYSIIGTFFCCIYFIGCGGTPPEIEQHFYQLNLLQGPFGEQQQQVLSIFVHVNDEDGIADLHSVYLIHDESELYWELKADEWIEKEMDQVTWIGTSGITMPAKNSFPSGKYRLLVRDKAGEEDETSFYLTASQLPAELSSEIPSISIDDNVIFSSPFEENYIRYYTKENRHLYSEPIQIGTQPYTSLLGMEKKEAEFIYIYSYHQKSGVGIITGPYALY